MGMGEKKYRVNEKDPESNQWCDLLNEDDEVLEFDDVEEAKGFIEYLREIDKSLEQTENVVYEV
jgi:hypothetical protein